MSSTLLFASTQVRHPEMQETFADEFRKWYQGFKSQLKKKPSKRTVEAGPASYFIICSLLAGQKELLGVRQTTKIRQTVEGEIAELLGAVQA